MSNETAEMFAEILGQIPDKKIGLVQAYMQGIIVGRAEETEESDGNEVQST